MANHKTLTKLLAVVALASACEPAPPAADHVALPDPWAHGARNASTGAAMIGAVQLIAMVAPRLMPSGAPACGNVAVRAPIECIEGSTP